MDDRKEDKRQEGPAKRQPPEHLLRRASGIAAIVIALLKNLAILELQKRCEVGAHLGSRRLALKRRGQSACPDNFQRHGISARPFILDFILLTSYGFVTAVGGGAYSSQLIAAAVGQEGAGKISTTAAGAKKWAISSPRAGLNDYNVPPRRCRVLCGAARARLSWHARGS